LAALKIFIPLRCQINKYNIYKRVKRYNKKVKRYKENEAIFSYSSINVRAGKYGKLVNLVINTSLCGRCFKRASEFPSFG
jgi:hypothetical protein